MLALMVIIISTNYGIFGFIFSELVGKFYLVVRRPMFFIEDAMRRAHRRPLIWSLAICDSLGNVSGEMVKCMSMLSLISGFLADLCGSWRFLAILAEFGPKLAETCYVKADAEMRLKICRNVMSRAPKTIKIREKSIPNP